MKHAGKKLSNAELCTHCGYCLPACPTYGAANDEALSPRGRVSIILALSRGDIKPDDASQALSSCLVCRACHTACPVGVRPAKLVLSVRGTSPITVPYTTRILHKITNSHLLTAQASRLIRLYQQSGLQRWIRRLKILRILAPLDRLERLIPGESSHPPVASYFNREQARQTANPPLKAALLCGCIARLLHSNVAPSTANLLQLCGVELTVLEGFGCCGAPFRESGKRDQFLKQARKTLDAFEKNSGVDVVVCDTSICFVTVRSYGRALMNDPHYASLAQLFTEKIRSLDGVLEQRLLGMIEPELRFDAVNKAVTFQDHCQTQHGFGQSKAARALIQQFIGPITEASKGERCCGAAGDYMLRSPELSQKIQLDKVAAIVETKADYLIGMNSGCLLNLEAGLRNQDRSIEVQHLSEALWQTLSNTTEQRERSR
ncbi:MAG: (Fe-S)-binding protein [Magnetococcales bacterium]|nr:(Fe-S)-binding protein [Magnetococcales bacterium]